MKRVLVLLLSAGLFFSCAAPAVISDSTVPKSAETVIQNPLLGTWTADFVSPVTGKDINHYKMQKPYIRFADDERIAGNNGCNNFAGYYTYENDVIDFKTEGFSSTRMFCEGLDEEAFINGLKMVNRFAIYRENKLVLMEGDAIIISLVKKEEEQKTD